MNNHALAAALEQIEGIISSTVEQQTGLMKTEIEV
jgi:hypothetical protein